MANEPPQSAFDKAFDKAVKRLIDYGGELARALVEKVNTRELEQFEGDFSEGRLVTRWGLLEDALDAVRVEYGRRPLQKEVAGGEANEPLPSAFDKAFDEAVTRLIKYDKTLASDLLKTEGELTRLGLLEDAFDAVRIDYLRRRLEKEVLRRQKMKSQTIERAKMEAQERRESQKQRQVKPTMN